jgi:hypothetical protein
MHFYRYNDGEKSLSKTAGSNVVYNNILKWGEKPVVHSRAPDVMSFHIGTSHSAFIGSQVLKAALFTLCHDLVCLQDVRSTEDTVVPAYTVVPATKNKHFGYTPLLRLRELDVPGSKGGPTFVIINPGVYAVIYHRFSVPIETSLALYFTVVC